MHMAVAILSDNFFLKKKKRKKEKKKPSALINERVICAEVGAHTCYVII